MMYISACRFHPVYICVPVFMKRQNSAVPWAGVENGAY